MVFLYRWTKAETTKKGWKPTFYKLSQRIPLYTVLFNRQSGTPYIRVKLTEDKLTPWYKSFEEDDAEQDQDSFGYLVLQEEGAEPFWDAEKEE